MNEVVAVPIGGGAVRFMTPKIYFSSNPDHALCHVHSLFQNEVCSSFANAIDILGDWRDSIQVREDGWIVGPHDRLLLWVPPMYLPGLYGPRTKCLIGIATMELDLSNFAHGPLWESCKDKENQHVILPSFPRFPGILNE